MGWVVKCWHVNETNLYPRFISTPAAATPPPPPGLAHSAENNDDVDFLGFEDVLLEAENLMRNQVTVTVTMETAAMRWQRALRINPAATSQSHPLDIYQCSYGRKVSCFYVNDYLE